MTFATLTYSNTMKKLKRTFILFYFILFVTSVQGQEFSVNQFRVLANDITAYITPVRDLNDEACALLKVVGNHDFVFSTPLGVVERRNEVGEIWLYLPKGTIQITIKHPKWGVLRDYRFAKALESRMTYELIIAEPIEYKHLATTPLKNIPTSLFIKDEVNHPVKKWKLIPFKRPKEPLHYLLLANMGISAKNLSAGIRFGMMRRHGGYLLYQTNFSNTPQTMGKCDKNGLLDNGTITPYYTGKTTKSEYMIIMGGVHRLWSSIYLYEGLGYGKRLVAWENADNTYYENSHYSTKGIAAEVGMMYRFNKFIMSVGTQTISGKHWEANIGFGIHF